jgi:hypothetical protein
MTCTHRLFQGSWPGKETKFLCLEISGINLRSTHTNTRTNVRTQHQAGSAAHFALDAPGSTSN